MERRRLRQRPRRVSSPLGDRRTTRRKQIEGRINRKDETKNNTGRVYKITVKWLTNE
jgi:hypothetical protein